MDLRAHHKPTFDNISAEKRSRILDAATNEFAVSTYKSGILFIIEGGSNARTYKKSGSQRRLSV